MIYGWFIREIEVFKKIYVLDFFIYKNFFFFIVKDYYSRFIFFILFLGFVWDFCMGFFIMVCFLFICNIFVWFFLMIFIFGLELNLVFFGGMLILIFLIIGLVIFCFSIISGFMYFLILVLFGGMMWIFCVCGMLLSSLGFILRVYLVIRGLILGVGVIRFDFRVVFFLRLFILDG